MLDTLLVQMKAKYWLKGLLVLFLLVSALWLVNGKKYTFSPATTFTTITGETITLQALQGKPVLVTFWATDCPSCIKEIPDLIALYKQFHSQGLEIIAVAMAYDRPNHVVAMSKANNLPYRVVLDLTGEYAKAFGRVWATPTTVLIAPEGKVSKSFLGPFKLNDMQTRIQHLLKG
jgi:peroxiredoxin